MIKLKAPESDARCDPNPEPDKRDKKGKKIINADPSAIVATTKLQREDLDDPKEGECLFHSHMWLKGSPLQFIVDNKSQKTSFQQRP